MIRKGIDHPIDTVHRHQRRRALGRAQQDRLLELTLMVLTSFSCMTGSILSSFLDMTQLATRPSEEMLKKFSSLGWSSLCQ